MIRMQHQEFETPAELKDAIKCFWHRRWDFDDALTSFEVLPDGYAEIVFHFGSSIFLNGRSEPLPSPFIMGLLNQPVILSSKNRLEILGIRCFPWTAFELL